MEKLYISGFFSDIITKMILERFAVLKVFVALWAVSYAQVIENGCPDEEDIKPCICSSEDLTVLECQNMTDPEALRNVFRNSARHAYDKFYLKDSSIPFLATDMFEKTPVVELHLENVNIVRLFDIPPDTLSDLFYLDMKNTMVLSKIRWDLLEPMTKLNSLNIYNGSIKTLDSEFSTYVTKELEELIFYKTETKTIKPGVFKDFVKLVTLAIQSCELTTLSRDMFPKPFKVFFLYFNENKITAIPEDLFTDMPYLHELNLAGNQIGILPESAFRDGFNSLHFLLLEGNPLKCDCLLYWLIKKPEEKPNVLQGTCASPKKLNGKELKDLTAGDFDCS